MKRLSIFASVACLCTLGFVWTVSAEPLMEVGYYKGNGAAERTISVRGNPFDIDLLIISRIDGTAVNPSSVWATSSMGQGLSKAVPNTAALNDKRVKSVGKGSFVVTKDDWVNASEGEYVWLAVNADPDFMVVGEYEGNRDKNEDTIQDVTWGNFPIWTPDMVVVLPAEALQGAFATVDFPTGKSLKFSVSNYEQARIVAFNETGFTVGNNNDVNKLGNKYHYIALKNKDGFFKTGMATNEGAPQTIDTDGLMPGIIIAKSPGKGAAIRMRDMAEDYEFSMPNSTTLGGQKLEGGITEVDSENSTFSIGADSKFSSSGKEIFWFGFQALQRDPDCVDCELDLGPVEASVIDTLADSKLDAEEPDGEEQGDEEDGCSCHHAPHDSPEGLVLWLLALGAFLIWRRTRIRR